MENALKLHEEELTDYESIGDVDSKAITLWEIAQIDWQQGRHQPAFDKLSESFALLMQLGRVEGLGAVGAMLGQILLASGDRENGGKVLGIAIQSLRKMGRDDDARQLQELLDQGEADGQGG